MECPFGNVESKLDTLIQLVTFVLEKEDKLMATLDEVIAEVSLQTTKIASLDTLVDGIRQQLLDVLEGTVIAPVVQKKIDDLFAQLKGQTAAIDSAIAENTIVEELPVEP